MRSIPAELKARIEKANMTLYENADPHMGIFVYNSRWNELFTVYTVHNKPNISRIDVTAKRETASSDPNKLYAIYIEDGVSYVISKPLPYNEMIPWTPEFMVGAADDVAIEFDGYWEQPDGGGRWNFVAYDPYPWIFWLNSGTLKGRYWDDGTTETTLATGVSRIAALRGWKSSKTPTTDDGLIVAYIKSGSVYYRNRCEQANGTLVWEDERLVSDLPSNCVDISLFRTNDYRVGFVVEDASGNIYWAITARTWAGFGIDEVIQVSMKNFNIDLIPIEYHYTYHNEKIAVSMQDFETALCPFIVIGIQSITNPDQSETDIIITFDRNISGIVAMPADFETAFSIVDESMNPVTVTGVAYEGSNAIKLTCNNFGGANGDLTVTYTKVPGVIGTHSKDMAGAVNLFTCWFDVENFVEIFTPDLSPPEGWNQETISVSMQNFVVDFWEPTSTTAVHEEKIAVSMQNFVIDFIHIDDIEV